MATEKKVKTQNSSNIGKRLKKLRPCLDFSLTTERDILRNIRHPDKIAIKNLRSIATKWPTIESLLGDDFDNVSFLASAMDSRIKLYFLRSFIYNPGKKANPMEIINFWEEYVPYFIKDMQYSITRDTIENHLVKLIKNNKYPRSTVLTVKEFIINKDKLI